MDLVAWIRRKPWVAASSVASKNRSSLNAPSSQTRLPSSPLSSTRRPSSWPVGVDNPQLFDTPQLPDEAPQLAVELDPEALVVAGGEAAGLEAAEGPAGEAADEHGRVVDRDRPQLATATGQGPLGHEGLGEGRHP